VVIVNKYRIATGKRCFYQWRSIKACDRSSLDREMKHNYCYLKSGIYDHISGKRMVCVNVTVKERLPIAIKV